MGSVMVAIDETTGTGVSFSLTEEQKELRRLAREFAEREIRPHEAECDEKMRHPEEVIAQAHRSGGGNAMSAFIVPMDAPAVTIEKHLDKMGQRATDTSAFALQDVRIPVENRLGEEGDGFKIAMATLDATRPGTAIGAVGVAQAAYDHSVEYAKEHVTFDVTYAMHQGVSFMIADMATEIEASRLLCWQAAWMLDQGFGRDATLYSSFAKRFAADTAMKVTTDAVQVFGGYGYIKEYPVEKLMRDAKLFQIYEGTSQIQRLVIAYS